MEQTPPCPDTQTLQNYVLGQVSEPGARALERHLTRCLRCLEMVETLQQEDALVAAMRAQARGKAEPPGEVVLRMIDRFGKLRGSALTAAGLAAAARARLAAKATPRPAKAPWRRGLYVAVPLLVGLGVVAGAWYVVSFWPASPQERPPMTRGESVPADEVRQLEGHTAEVECVAFLPDGQQALSGGRDRVVRLWDLQTGKQVRQFPEQSGWIHALAVSADGRQALAAGGSKKEGSPTRADCAVRLLDLESGREVKPFPGHTEAVNALAFVPGDRRFLSIGWDASIRLWDAAAAKEVSLFQKQPGFPLGVAVAPDGKNAVTGGTDGVVRVWDLATGKVTQRCQANAEAVFCVAYAAEGRHVFAAGADNTVRLWDLQTAKVVQSYTGHTEKIWTVAVSPDGKRLLSGSLDRTVRLWDVESGKQLHNFTGHSKGVQCVTFAPDGRRALSCSGDRTIRLW
jgi:WD40 repeat protein